ncbi:NAD(P)/FAD-dependent oxidoreductase [Fulvimonas soli]|jgi:D-amino-acid dehydrogenase|uniref:D-amino acid dehydrogenase small subunit n=1 Tax=Fulvimonas soli TaxID=155197 RepID=A0A316IK89_9GAMM|nr:FAD-dependent oxidoreductase [Fulvimonas soli]PWK87622.1 D-amino acid dehydrogenase small subunit [Fulvimonas soli]TNY25807.1 amino acid dehydrogenase [Fulvimonas soli]
MNSPDSDVLILGAGVIGLSCALHLLRAGVGVRVLEQGAPGCGASHGNCGTITPSHAAPLAMPGTFGVALRSMLRADAPLYLNPRFDGPRLRWLLGFARHCNWRDFARAAQARSAILQRSRALLGELVRAEGLDCEFAEEGELYVYRTAAQLAADLRHHADVLDRLGVAVERLDGAAVEAREPALKPGVAGGLFHPGDARLRPDRYVAELARRVRELGGAIETDARIGRIEAEAGRVARVRTTRGDFAGGRVVMALGAWSPLLGRQLGLRLPMQPGKGYSITYARPRLAPRHALVLREAAVCVTTWSSGYRLGSTMEFSGYAEGLNRTRLDALRRGAAQGLREPEGPEVLEEWWGWRPMSVDEVPIIGPSTRLANLHLATAHGMLGVSMSAATGELVAAQLTGAAPAIDPAPYAPARFGL